MGIKHEQVNQLYNYSPTAIFGNVFIAAIVTYILFGNVPDTGLFIWAFLIFTNMCLRVINFYQYKSTNQFSNPNCDVNKWLRFHQLGVLITGVLWGGSVYFADYFQLVDFRLMITAIGFALAGGATFTLGVVFSSYIAFTIPMLSIISISMFMSDTPTHFESAILILLGIGFAVSTAYRYSKNSYEILLRNHEISEANNKILQQAGSLELKVKEKSEELLIARDEAVKANKAKSEFLANISHELRTPLNAILGFSELLAKDTGLSEEQKEKLVIINSSGGHLLSLINDVLDISKIESGKVELGFEIFNLHKLLQEIGDMFKLPAKNAQLHFEVDLASNLMFFVKADANKLRQILINLLDNALKFTRQGGFSLRARTLAVNDSSRNLSLIIEVQDSGHGIPVSEIALIFDPFVQSKQYKCETKGTGLGLAISQSFVKMMKGSLKVVSEVDKGTLFTLEIPLRMVDTPKLKSFDNNQIETGFRLSEKLNRRVLVVEDCLENRQLLNHILTHTAVKVKEAENGEQAVTLFQQWQPHFIWMDMRMPVMDGYEAIRRIRALPGGEKVMIIAVTANANSDEQNEILAAGCDAVLHKPYRASEIFNTMEKYLGIKYVD